MKRSISVLLVVAMLVTGLSLMSGTAKAEEAYTVISAGLNREEAPGIEFDKMYASSLVGSQTVYFKFTTPSQKGYIDFYTMNINIQTDSWYDSRAVHFQIINDLNQVLYTNQCRFGYVTHQNINLRASTTYYLKVFNANVVDQSGAGNMKFKLTYRNDFGGDLMGTAEQIDLSNTQEGSLDGYGDVDYYVFSTGRYSQFTVSMKNINIQTNEWYSDRMVTLIVHSALQEVLVNMSAGQGKSNSNTVTLQPNTMYYIKIYNPDWKEYGTGNYTFSVDPVLTPIGDATITYNNSAVYTGSEIKPAVTVTYLGNTLTENTDYTLAYSQNTLPGNGTVTITGIGLYSGTVTRNFTITKLPQPMTVEGKKVVIKYQDLLEHNQTVKKSKILVIRNAQGKLGYSVANNGKIKKLKISSTGTLIVPKGTAKGTYTVKIKVKAKGTKIYEAGTVIVKVKVIIK